LSDYILVVVASSPWVAAVGRGRRRGGSPCRRPRRQPRHRASAPKRGARSSLRGSPGSTNGPRGRRRSGSPVWSWSSAVRRRCPAAAAPCRWCAAAASPLLASRAQLAL